MENDPLASFMWQHRREYFVFNIYQISGQQFSRVFIGSRKGGFPLSRNFYVRTKLPFGKLKEYETGRPIRGPGNELET